MGRTTSTKSRTTTKRNKPKTSTLRNTERIRIDGSLNYKQNRRRRKRLHTLQHFQECRWTLLFLSQSFKHGYRNIITNKIKQRVANAQLVANQPEVLSTSKGGLPPLQKRSQTTA